MKKLALFLSMQGVTFNTRKRQIAIVSYVQQHDKEWTLVVRCKEKISEPIYCILFFPNGQLISFYMSIL